MGNLTECVHPRLYTTHLRGRRGTATCPDCQKSIKVDSFGQTIIDRTRIGGFVAFWVVVVVLLAASFWLWW
jgi:hypothetical protein